MTPCAPNSAREETSSYGAYRKGKGLPKYECIAGYRAHANRGRVDTRIKQAGATTVGKVYGLGAGSAEYIAEGRLLARLHGAPTDMVSPTYQWETSMPTNGKRLDVMRYLDSHTSNTVEVAELKGNWYQDAPAAREQVDRYVDELGAAGASASPWLVTLGGAPFNDVFYKGEQCVDSPGQVEGWEYTVSAPLAGVVYIERARVSCPDGQEELTEAERDAYEKHELALDQAEDGEDVPELTVGEDADGNGIEDSIEIVRAADTEDQQALPAPTNADSPVIEVGQMAMTLTRGQLYLLNRAYIRVAIEYGMFKASQLFSETAIRIAGVTTETELGSAAGRVVLLAGELVGERIPASLAALGREGTVVVTRALTGAEVTFATKGLSRAVVKELLVRGLTLAARAVLMGTLLTAGMVILDGILLAWLILEVAGAFGVNVWGDPHLVTLDRRTYDLQSAGEFVLARTPDQTFEAQVRFAAVTDHVSVAEAYAFRLAGDVVEVRDDGVALVNGVPVDSEEVVVTTPGDVTMVHLGSRWSLLGRDDVLIEALGWRASVMFPAGVATSGLLGNNNGVGADDLALPDGTPVEERVLYESFDDAWRVSDESSLFTYPEGTGTADYTDLSAPRSVVRLADYTTSALQVAQDQCADAGVASGPVLESCLLDMLLTGNTAFAATAGAVPADVGASGQIRFDTQGTWTQDFDAAVTRELAYQRVIPVSASSTAVGPIYDHDPYRFTVTGMPRHDNSTVTLTLLALGTANPSQRVSLEVNDQIDATLDVSGEGSVVSGPTGTTITAEGQGTTETGVGYRAFQVQMPSGYAGSFIKAVVSTTGFNAIESTGLAVDQVQVTTDAPSAQSATGLDLPFAAASTAGSGLGTLETAGAADEYEFTLSQATDVLIETSQASTVRVELRASGANTPFTATERDYHLLYRALPAGTYRAVVTSRGAPVPTYHFDVLTAPDPQLFTLTLGDRVSDGMIANLPTPGAGNLETTASKDIYGFEVSASQAGNWVFETGGLLPVCRDAVLVDESTQEQLGSPCTTTGFRLDVELTEGAYRIEVPVWGAATGGYSITTYRKPDVQEFAYTMGQSITPGYIGGALAEGAGSIETPASLDVYRFTISPAQADTTWVFPAQAVVTHCRNATLHQGASEGTVLGGVCVTGTIKEYTLPAGEYRIEVPSYNSETGDYSLRPYVKSPAEVFAYQLGQTVTDGAIGDLTVAGAGRLETSSSKDIYQFTVPAAQAGKTWTFEGFSNGIWPRCAGSGIFPGATGGSSLGSVCGHLEILLAAGDYRIEIPAVSPGWAGSYSFRSYEKPPAQEFTYSLGQTITDGQIGGDPAVGAGRLETTSSKDVYRLVVSADQAGKTWVFEGLSGTSVCAAARLYPGTSGGTSVGSVCSRPEVVLPQGDYRVEVPTTSSYKTGPYSFTSYEKPDPQEFVYELGQTVADGTIGGVATPGAGRLETSVSKDVYRLTVTTDQTGVWKFSGTNGLYPRCSDSKLYPGATGGTTMGSVCSSLTVTLNPGEYRIEVPVGGNGSGSYTFKSVRQ